MRVLRTELATDWPKDFGRSAPERLIRGLLWFNPRGNPDYDSKMHLVHQWLIEFDETGIPGREIGIDISGRPVLAGPDSRNYGFWLDTNMRFQDFHDGEAVSADQFAQLWKASGVDELDHSA